MVTSWLATRTTECVTLEVVLCSLIQIIPAFETLFLCNSLHLEGVEVKAVMDDRFLRVGWRLRGILRLRSQGVDPGEGNIQHFCRAAEIRLSRISESWSSK